MTTLMQHAAFCQSFNVYFNECINPISNCWRDQLSDMHYVASTGLLWLRDIYSVEKQLQRQFDNLIFRSSR